MAVVLHKVARPIAWVKDENGCMICTSHASGETNNCYPNITRNNKRESIARLILRKGHGGIPEEMVARHKCDNRRCINPDHIEIGTHQDNVRDTLERGRTTKGVKNPMAKLDDESALAIRNSNLPWQELCRIYNISRRTVVHVQRGDTWKHV